MKYVKFLLIIIGVYILQTMIVQKIVFWGISPNLFLIVTCGISFLFGSRIGGGFGLLLGLLQDMNIGRAIGLSGFLFMYIGIMVGQFNKRFFKDNYIVSVTLMVLATFLYETIVYIFAALAYGQSFSFSMFIVKILIAAFSNAVVGIITYPILLHVNIGVELQRRIFGKR